MNDEIDPEFLDAWLGAEDEEPALPAPTLPPMGIDRHEVEHCGQPGIKLWHRGTYKGFECAVCHQYIAPNQAAKQSEKEFELT